MAGKVLVRLVIDVTAEPVDVGVDVPEALLDAGRRVASADAVNDGAVDLGDDAGGTIEFHDVYLNGRVCRRRWL